VARRADAPVFSVTLERGTDGSYLAWVDDLPGCAVRGASRHEVLEALPAAIHDFRAWIGAGETPLPEIVVAEEVASAIEADEDTDVLVAVDRRPLGGDDWAKLERWLDRSRGELLALLDGLGDEDLGRRREGSERTAREEVEHVGFVELMYAAWTFDLESRRGLAEFLTWTRRAAAERMADLAARSAGGLTRADWAGAPRPEPWTPRKAARRLVWHELLHLRGLERFFRRSVDAR
jgi:predicted RNase H-like HicB family nuclease